MRNAQRCGELVQDADLDTLASFFTVSLIGIAATARAEVDPTQIKAAADVVAGVLARQGRGAPQVVT